MSKIREVNQENLKEKGRLQFFYHSKSSELPVRDVKNEHGEGPKTEPHIEIGAENYLNECVQTYVNSFANSEEKYLFLFTNCSNSKMKEYHKKRFIVGYIVKEVIGETQKNQKSQCKSTSDEPFTFIKGETFLYRFQDAMPLTDLNFKKFRAQRLLDAETTQKILMHFRGKDNILNECIKEIKRLDSDNITCYRVTSNFKCNYKDECLRWKAK